MTQETDSFIQEVDEKLREDRMVTVAKRFGPYLLGLLIVLLASVGGWQFWREQQQNAARAQSERYAAAQEFARAGNLDEAKAAFEALSDTGPRSYRVMAQMERAAVLQVQGDLQGALAGFDAAAEAASDPIMKATAQLRAAYIVADTQDFAALQTRLNPIIEEGGQFGVLAQELLAVEAWEAGQTDLARSTLDAISLAFEAPESVRQRAQLALTVLGPAPDAASGPDAGAAPTPAPTQGE